MNFFIFTKQTSRFIEITMLQVLQDDKLRCTLL